MPTNDYHFITHWRMQSTPEEITEIIRDANDLTRWWPSVYLNARVLQTGDERGVGSVIDLYTKGWLPYTLRWRFRVSESRAPFGLTLEANGDFVGRGIWTFEADGDWVNITYDWKISAEKPLLKLFSPLMKPLFSANHLWAMRQGETSLQRELQRRHAPTEAARAAVPPPPPPTPSAPLQWLVTRFKGQAR